MDLSEMGEFGFLERLRARWPQGSALVGIGDDAAVARVRDGMAIVVATDALVEGVHFRLDWSTPADVGWKAVAVNLSDLAAMGAEPRWMLGTLAAPPTTTEEVLFGLYDGIDEACRAYGTELIGGDTVRSRELVLSVIALGEVEGDPLRRSGAKVGDVLAVTGPLGKAAAGLNLLLSQNPKGIAPEDALACMDAHRRPAPRVAEGIACRRGGVHAAIDLSDGLASDARRMAERSEAGVEIDLDRIPVAPEARRVADARGWDVPQMVLGGGEDQELLVALPPGSSVAGTNLVEIGRVVQEGVWLVRDGRREELRVEGWDHFTR